MTHVFIVNEDTFDFHLRYLFAGTGYWNYEPNLDKEDEEEYPAEKTLTAMIADISKVRIDDYIIFYVAGCKKFYGIFQAASLPFFYSLQDHNLSEENQLNKYLPFRIKIKPYKVYPIGITEHCALDEIDGIEHPYGMCWSLIYRKLTGKRGCSFITECEFQRLKMLIEKANENYLNSKFFSYDKYNQEIIPILEGGNYTGKSNVSLNIENRLFHKKGSYEVHLQAYIIQNYDKSLSNILLPDNSETLWIGNEVGCSFGKQRIDVLIVSETVNEIAIRVIELKDKPPKAEIINQLQWYITWVDQYISPNLSEKNKAIKIIPTIIAKRYDNDSIYKEPFERAFKAFVIDPPLKNSKLSDIEYFSFKIINNDIKFKKETVI